MAEVGTAADPDAFAVRVTGRHGIGADTVTGTAAVNTFQATGNDFDGFPGPNTAGVASRASLISMSLNESAPDVSSRRAVSETRRTARRVHFSVATLARHADIPWVKADLGHIENLVAGLER